jgi:hypothetical protein
MTAAVIAGNAHFVGAPTISTNGDLLTVSGKVAGLGNVPQIHVVLEATASCINGGGNHPRAVNKASFNTAGDFPVQNGRAIFSLALEAVFSPSCDPPMTVAWSDVQLTVTADDGTILTFP